MLLRAIIRSIGPLPTSQTQKQMAFTPGLHMHTSDRTLHNRPAVYRDLGEISATMVATRDILNRKLSCLPCLLRGLFRLLVPYRTWNAAKPRYCAKIGTDKGAQIEILRLSGRPYSWEVKRKEKEAAQDPILTESFSLLTLRGNSNVQAIVPGDKSLPRG